MAKRHDPTVDEIMAHIKSLGGKEVTEEDKKAPGYKAAFEWPSCFAPSAPRKPRKKITVKKQSGFKDTTAKKAAV